MSEQISRRNLVLGAGAILASSGAARGITTQKDPAAVTTKLDGFRNALKGKNLPKTHFARVKLIRDVVSEYNDDKTAAPDVPTEIPDNNGLAAFLKRLEVKEKVWQGLQVQVRGGQTDEPIHGDEEAELVGALSPPP